VNFPSRFVTYRLRAAFAVPRLIKNLLRKPAKSGMLNGFAASGRKTRPKIHRGFHAARNFRPARKRRS
jgi:hypothetical protein